MNNDKLNLSNDNNIIYLIKEGNKKPLLYLFNKYKYRVDFIINSYISKFYNLPIEKEDLNSYVYLWISDAVWSYKEKYNKKFCNYLIVFVKWKILNLINNFLSNKHKIINNAEYINDYNIKTLNPKDDIENILLLQDVLKKIKWTNLEKEILNYKLKGISNTDIIDKTSYSYKKIDNTFLRIKNKLKSLQYIEY